MATITKEEVRHVAHLARLAITEEEVEHFTEQLAKIVQFADKLNELDTSDVEPTTHVLPLENIMREDKSVPGLDRDVMLKNVKEHEAGQVKVPAIME